MCEKDNIIMEKLDAIASEISKVYNTLATLIMDKMPDQRVPGYFNSGDYKLNLDSTCNHLFIEQSDGTFECHHCPARKDNDGKNL